MAMEGVVEEEDHDDFDGSRAAVTTAWFTEGYLILIPARDPAGAPTHPDDLGSMQAVHTVPIGKEFQPRRF